MTSNMGSGLISENFTQHADSKGEVPQEVVDKTRDEVIELLKQHLKPEFLNRIDEIIMFTPLTRRDTLEIVDIQMHGIARMLEQNGIRLEVTEKARTWLADEGFDPLYGARPIKRTIQRYVVNELSKEILSGKIDREKPVVIDAGKEGLTFSNK